MIIQLAAEMKANNDEIPPDSVSLWVKKNYETLSTYCCVGKFFFSILSFNCYVCLVGLRNGY